MSLEDCVREAGSIGAFGVEIIPEQSMTRYPNPGDEFYRVWDEWMEKYGTTTVATDLFLDTKRYPGRVMTLAEMTGSVRKDLDIAKRMGAKFVRAIINTPPEVMEDCAPYAERLGLKLLLEVHAPFHYEHPWILRHLEVMHRLQSPALGFMPDMGTFVERFPRVMSERALRDGARPKFVELAVETYNNRGDVHGLMDTFNYMGANPVEQGIARLSTFLTWNEPRVMLEHMPLIHHIQAKFYEMTDDGSEYSIPYHKIIPVLIEGGYDGYLSSEYEGNRHIQDIVEVDSVEQVRRQHRMFQRLLGEETTLDAGATQGSGVFADGGSNVR
ncbi:sugar phosphate isomerase/epimerase family protein [Paenarthrobacter sp. NPDC091711]|uniref:sugar phosphate isomerase/epimerase family protein n=1 Tax=Paenarthrobacter sp. NPDC091711 TaxID=3364385 RepID=UPI003823CEEC